MLNVQNLTNTLSRMPLPQLQQYAALHKDDPYVVSLALSIANQKKQMMASQAGQAGMQPQPKVVDQAIAEMAPVAGALPEDVGIGALPAQNMQRMAEGGIVAFDDGGQVPGYAEGVFTGTSLTPYIEKYAQEYKLDPSVLSRIIQAESEGKTTAKNPKSSAHGAGQLLDSMWKKMGGGERKDVETQIRNAAKLLRSNADNFKTATGREPTASEAYVTWVLGDSTGRAVLAADPKTPIENVIKNVDPRNAKDIIGSNAAIIKNKSVSDFTNWADTKIRLPSAVPISTAQAAPASAPASAPAPANVYKDESFLDKAKRAGEGVVGNLEAGLNALTGMAAYPIGMYGAIASSPSAAYAATQGLPEKTQFYDRMRDIQQGFTYQPRTAFGEEQAEDLSKTLSFLPPYIAGPGVGRSRAIKGKPTKTGTKPRAAETPTAKVGEQLPLFPELETAPPPATAPATAPAAAYPTGIFGLTPAVPEAVKAAQAKQAAAKAALAQNEAPAPTFPITPENAGIAAVQRSMIAKNQAAEAAARAEAARAAETQAKPEPPVIPTQETAKPAEVSPDTSTVPTEKAPALTEKAPALTEKAPALTEAEMLDRARAFELDQQKAAIIGNRMNALKAGLPGLAAPTPVTGTATQAQEPEVTGGMPSLNEAFRKFEIEQQNAEERNKFLPKPEEKPTEVAAAPEEKKEGMDWNDFMIKMGLNLMAGESPNALTNVGRAGLGTLAMQQAEAKAKSEEEAKRSEADYRKAMGKYYGAYGEAIERGAKEKNNVALAEKAAIDAYKAWADSNKVQIMTTPGLAEQKMQDFRAQMYRHFGIEPTMATGAPAGQRLTYNPETGKIG